MTREEAFKKYKAWRDLGYGHSTMPSSEVLVMAIDALHPITREQVEKVWRGEWQVCFEEWPKHRIEGEQCSKCGFQNYGPSYLYNFCPNCGAPMTDKAVDMVMERLEALKDGSTTD